MERLFFYHPEKRTYIHIHQSAPGDYRGKSIPVDPDGLIAEVKLEGSGSTESLVRAMQRAGYTVCEAEAVNRAAINFAMGMMCTTPEKGPEGESRLDWTRELLRHVVSTNLVNLLERAVDKQLFEEAAIIRDEVDARIEKGFIIRGEDGSLIPNTVLGCLTDESPE